LRSWSLEGLGSMRWNSFDRVRRFSSPPTGINFSLVGSAIFAALVLVALIVLLATIADLLISRGTLRIPAGEQAEISAIAGPPNIVNGPAADSSAVIQGDGAIRPEAAGPIAEYQHRGLLPLVYRLRSTMFGPISNSFYQSWPSLRTNGRCLLTLIFAGWVLALLYGLALYAWQWSALAAAHSGVLRLRHELYHQSVRLGAGDLLLGQKQSAVELFVDRIDLLAAGLAARARAIPHSILLLVLCLGIAMLVEPLLTLAAILLAVLSGLMLAGLRVRAARIAIRWADTARQQRTTLVEDLRQVRLLGNFLPGEKTSNGSFDQRLAQWHTAELRERAAHIVAHPAVAFFVLAGVGLLLLLGGLNVLREPPRVSLSGLVLLTTALAATIFPIRVWQRYVLAMPQAEAAAAEIMAYLDRQPAVGQVPEARPLMRPKRDLALVNVTLADPRGHKLLDGVSLTIPCGSRTAVLASDRETPLALAGLLPRYYDPTAGRILCDGTDIGRVTLGSLRSEIAILMPERVLVTGTVRENIACDDPRFSAIEVADAARQALVYDFVQQLPQGFDTIVGDHGFHLPPPEQLLLGLARLMLHNPAVVVLGELAEVFDPLLEERLTAAIDRLAQRRTLIFLARRLPTLRSAERILLFHEGKLSADGTHAELLAESELYRHLNYVRFNVFRHGVSGEW
jgi:ABC-type multidrug transport system fused ATPase/permease subunit